MDIGSIIDYLKQSQSDLGQSGILDNLTNLSVAHSNSAPYGMGAMSPSIPLGYSAQATQPQNNGQDLMSWIKGGFATPDAAPTLNNLSLNGQMQDNAIKGWQSSDPTEANRQAAINVALAKSHGFDPVGGPAGRQTVSSDELMRNLLHMGIYGIDTGLMGLGAFGLARVASPTEISAPFEGNTPFSHVTTRLAEEYNAGQNAKNGFGPRTIPNAGIKEQPSALDKLNKTIQFYKDNHFL